MIADPIVRNRGTIGGALCQADPSEDLSAVCAAVGAKLVIRGTDGSGCWECPSSIFRPTARLSGRPRSSVEIRVPLYAHQGSAYEKVDRRAGDWAVAAAGASIQLRQ